MKKMKWISLVLLLGSVGILAVPAFADEDTGASAIPRFRKVNDNLYRGGQPGEADIVALRELGVRSIISLIRSPKDLIEWERKAAHSQGMKYYNFPMAGLLFPGKRKVTAALLAMVDPANQPVFIHCKEGKDRTGLMVGLYRFFVDHWTREQAWNEMRSIGYNRWYFPLDWAFWSTTESAMFTPNQGETYAEELE